jgi:hypothetical protein
MKTKGVIITVNLKELEDNLSELPDDKKVEFAINLGINGDLTYELRLLQELCKLIPEVYPLNSMDEKDELVPVVKSLLELKKHLLFLDNE